MRLTVAAGPCTLTCVVKTLRNLQGQLPSHRAEQLYQLRSGKLKPNEQAHTERAGESGQAAGQGLLLMWGKVTQGERQEHLSPDSTDMSRDQPHYEGISASDKEQPGSRVDSSPSSPASSQTSAASADPSASVAVGSRLWLAPSDLYCMDRSLALFYI
ncbi:hypothetical protein H920_08148 [Fukomys damarensis]|uniref:Uncharacterized protein n=1 Tax=Fukomys damarensis TaxID=885580 RepID=A0A091DH90_FUKDA|nr:hypothetical protein H920_08148 [Fukomys damarensis]